MIRSLRAGDEQAFSALVSMHHRSLCRTARKYVRDEETAEEVVQETWLGLLDSLDRFEGRCSLKTWLFRILVNKAKTRGCRDQRFIPFSRLADHELSTAWSSADPGNFTGPESPVGPGHWIRSPSAWSNNPESLLQDSEAMDLVRQAIEELPPAQGMVMHLRDVCGLSSEEVCRSLELTPGNQRVLLHRARTQVRRALSARYGNGL